ncbi:MAG: threonylcarbamoyl-AMP synthase [Clostridia bacterium]|nr:threonylcarbamoyl-AMP synthase [Clostridia bacterium]
MNTKLYKITDCVSQKNEIKEIASLLKKGEAVAIPTETVYGIAADCFNESAVEKIFEAKGRPSDNPLIVHIAKTEELYSLVKEVPEKAKMLADKYWPGPLTIILPKKDSVSDKVSGGLPTVAVRMPSHPVARAIIEEAGVPLAAPSANISGFPSPTSASYVIDDMYGRLPAIVDGGDCDFGIESTVVTLATDVPVLLRPGAVTYEQLTEILGKVKIHSAVLNPLEEGVTAASPGMKYKHYSPDAKLIILNGTKEEFIEFINNNPHFADFALCFQGEENDIPLPSVTFGTENDPFSQAKRLFDAFRELDGKGAKKVLVRSPSREGVGLGVCNRLYRAAGFNFLSPKQGLVIGLTGESGSGKSKVSEMLREKGCIIIDADKIARSITEKGSPVLKKLASFFGDDIIEADGTLNRRLLASRAFKDYESKILLDSITHPEIVNICEKRANEETDKGNCVIIDAPLLFTSGLWKICHKTVKVYAPEEIRLKRILERDKITEEEILLRFSKQTEENEAAKSADIIVNNYPPYNLEEEINKII